MMRKLKVLEIWVFAEVLLAMLHSKHVFEYILNSLPMFYDFRFLRFNLNPYFSKHLKRKVNFALYFYVFILFFSVISHQISFH